MTAGYVLCSMPRVLPCCFIRSWAVVAVDGGGSIIPSASGRSATTLRSVRGDFLNRRIRLRVRGRDVPHRALDVSMPELVLHDAGVLGGLRQYARMRALEVVPAAIGAADRTHSHILRPFVRLKIGAPASIGR